MSCQWIGPALNSPLVEEAVWVRLDRFARCRRTAAASGSSFYYSFLFLPAERRQAITALYSGPR